MEQLETITAQTGNWAIWGTTAMVAGLALLAMYVLAMLLGSSNPPVPLRYLQPASLRIRLITAIVGFTGITAVTVALLTGQWHAHDRQSAELTALAEKATSAADTADRYLDAAVNGMTTATRQLRKSYNGRDRNLAAELARAHENLPAFETLVLADAAGMVLAATSIIEGKPKPFPGPARSLRRQLYFLQPVQTGLPYMTDVVRAFGHEDAIVVGVPISDTQNGRGALVGVVDKKQLAGRLTPIAGRHSALTLTDRAGKRLLDVAAPGTGPVSGTRIAASATSAGQWRIDAHRPHEIVSANKTSYVAAIMWTIAALLIASVLARRLAKSIANLSRPLESALKDIDVDGSCTAVDMPANVPREFQTIFDQAGNAARRVQKSYRKLSTTVERGEKLRGELIHLIGEHQSEIAQRGDELQAARDALEQARREDSLTGLANRRALVEFLDRTWRGALRESTPIGILLIGIDEFRAYNDTYGPDAGDKCLKKVAENIRRIAGRAADLAARLGDDEFIVILGNTALEGALKVGENIRSAIQHMSIEHAGSKLGATLTVSAGVTSAVPSPNTRPEELLAGLDQALCKAKSNGRNQVAYCVAAQTGLYQALCMTETSDSRPS